jgi:hypothetical protein
MSLLESVEAMLQARAVVEASSPVESKRIFETKLVAHAAAVEALEAAAKVAKESEASLSYYARPVEMPKNMRQGLMNAVQLAINAAAGGDSRECVLQLVNLLDDLGSNSNPYRIEGKA